MSDDPIGESLDHVAGQVHALKAALLAMARLYPDPKLLLREIERVSLAATARAEATELPDVFLEGMRDVLDPVRTILQQRGGGDS